MLLRFIKRFKSFDVIRKMGKTRFLDSYQVLVKKTKDRFAGSKGLAIYELVLNSITTRGENPLSAMTQDQCVDLVSTAQNAADEINLQMRIIAETIPEYKVLRSMAGVGDRLGPIILGEIGDIRRFHSGKHSMLTPQRCPAVSVRTVREPESSHFQAWQPGSQKSLF